MRVGVAGALGRMGRVTCAALEAAPDLQLVATFKRGDDLDAFYKTPMDVVVDFTVAPVTFEVARKAVEVGVSPVIGATGWVERDVNALKDAAGKAKLGAMLVPNFAIGAVLLMRFAELAAPHFGGVEIIEMHHETKKDKPSGTARLTAQRIEAAAPDLAPVPVHSVRLPGLVAHQSVLFGTSGQTLELRHDSLARESFADGILLAVREVRKHPGLTIGLDAILFEAAR